MKKKKKKKPHNFTVKIYLLTGSLWLQMVVFFLFYCAQQIFLCALFFLLIHFRTFLLFFFFCVRVCLCASNFGNRFSHLWTSLNGCVCVFACCFIQNCNCFVHFFMAWVIKWNKKANRRRSLACFSLQRDFISIFFFRSTVFLL